MHTFSCAEPNHSLFGRLEHLSYIQVIGQEARLFLQNQCTGDLNPLKVGECLFTGYCQPQGRLLATMLVICLSKNDLNEESMALILPTEILETINKRLQKYVMRSKVKLSLGEKSLMGFYTPRTSDIASDQKKRLGPWSTQTWFSISPKGYAVSFTDVFDEHSVSELPSNIALAKMEDWIKLDILQARPWIFSATMEKCLPQMVGLQYQGGVSFSKGCYPGQEVIARMHYRGKSKRNLYRLFLPLSSDNGTSTFLPKFGTAIWNCAKKEVGIILLATYTADAILLLASLLDESRHQPLLVPDANEVHIPQTVKHIELAVSNEDIEFFRETL